MSVNFTTDWPTNTLDWVATVGFGVALGIVLLCAIWVVIGR